MNNVQVRACARPATRACAARSRAASRATATTAPTRATASTTPRARTRPASASARPGEQKLHYRLLVGSIPTRRD